MSVFRDARTIVLCHLHAKVFFGEVEGVNRSVI